MMWFIGNGMHDASAGHEAGTVEQGVGRASVAWAAGVCMSMVVR